MKAFLKFSAILASLLYCSAALGQPLGQGNGPGPLPPSVLLGQANTWSAAQTFSALGTFSSGLLAPQINIGSTGTGSIAVSNIGTYCWTASSSSTAACDSGFVRDSVLGAGNLDLGNGSANDKSGTLNAAKVALGGCTIGTDNFCVTGQITVSSTIHETGNFLSFVATGVAQGSGSIGNIPSNVNIVNNANSAFVALGAGQLSIGNAAVSHAAWTTGGIGAVQTAQTYTDSSTANSGTVATSYINLFDTPTIASTGTSVTYTTAFGTYFKNPAAGTNVTISSPFALGADSFKVANGSTFGGALTLGGNSIVGVGALVAGGSAPTGSGTCTRGAQTGGQTTGTIVLTCTAQTLILTFSTTAPTGWMCEAIDQTTTADTMKQTANSTTTCTLTGTTAASDVILFQARAY